MADCCSRRCRGEEILPVHKFPSFIGVLILRLEEEKEPDMCVCVYVPCGLLTRYVSHSVCVVVRRELGGGTVATMKSQSLPSPN
jgi:hypothetical protein